MAAGTKVVLFEKAFLALGAILLVCCLVALAYASVAMGIELPGRVAQIDPAEVDQTPPFDTPGVRQIGPDAYEAVVVGFAWGFRPGEIRVPQNADVTFTSTTTDVLHGFSIEGTRVNMMLIPGQVSQKTYRFDAPGEYLLICHEYCGLAHHAMYGRVIVVPAGEPLEEPFEPPTAEPDTTNVLPADPDTSEQP